jgi:hypothetical protein
LRKFPESCFQALLIALLLIEFKISRNNFLKDFCMTPTLSFDEAVNLLKKFVKFSEVKNQKHIDLSLCTAQERPLAQRSLVIANLEVEKGTLTQVQLLARLGLD